MGVSEAEFQRVRGLVEQALAEQFGDLLVPPAELRPGYWELWPIRDIRLGVEETQIWHYGAPVGGTGRLQIHIEYPYGNHSRVHAKKDRELTEKQVLQAVKTARMLSDQRAAHLRMNTIEKQEGYLFGYRSFWNMEPERQRRLYSLFEDVVTAEGASKPWSALHEAIKRLFMNSRQVDEKAWDLLFKGPVSREMSPRDWSPRGPIGYSDAMYDLFHQGVMAALDDWEQRRRFYD